MNEIGRKRKTHQKCFEGSPREREIMKKSENTEKQSKWTELATVVKSRDKATQSAPHRYDEECNSQQK